MIHGIDTDFLVAVEVREHPFHQQADALLTALQVTAVQILTGLRRRR